MLVNVERLQSKMDQEGLDGLVATTLPNVHYFAGYISGELADFPYDGQCYAIITRDMPSKPFIISTTVELDMILDGFPVLGTIGFGSFYREGPFGDVVLTKDEEWLRAATMDSKLAIGPLEGLIAGLERIGLADKKVGIDELGLMRGYFEELAEKLPRARFSKASDLLRWVRRVKTPKEIYLLREVARITENAIIASVSIAHERVTEYELAREFERSIVSQGGRPQFTLIRVGRNGVAGQRIPDRTSLKNGDLIWFDVGARFRGYCSDLARTFCLGEPEERIRKIYTALLEGENAGIQGTYPGMTGGDLFDIVMKASHAAGFPTYRRRHVGHGIGAEIYEAPLLASGNQVVIEEGMVINIETPYYEFGLGALHIEDPYVVGSANNNKLLTGISRELQIIST